VSVSVFSLYVGVFGEQLTPRIVFTTFTLFNLLQYSVTKHIPNAIMGLSECYVACQRIQSFLELPDQQVEHSSTGLMEDEKKEGDSEIEQQTCIEISEGTTCYWENTEIKTKLPMALHSATPHEFCSGRLYCVIGKVGSGKSALLQALIGELPVSSGNIHRNGSKSISYAAQDPWIMDGTARENIVMGLPFDEEWYDKVVKACCLQSDFEAFPQGDGTIVGDRGVQCSGGQRARLNLARALYCDSDVIVLDDPLSAVDAKVARTIFSVAIKELGVRRGKCVILVTHQLQFANGSDSTCIFMDGGKIMCCGSFSDCASKSSIDLSTALQAGDAHEDNCEGKAAAKENVETMQEDSKPADDTFVEKRQTGVITKRTWLSYMDALGGRIVTAIFLAVFSATQGIFLITILYIGAWAYADDQDTARWFGIVFGLTLATAFLAVFRALFSFYLFLSASQKLHNKMLASVLRATIEFYDTNPLGRILNRFASDVGIVDEQLPLVMYEFGVGFIM
jgi:ATP-binding cassette subfamily C (CFTR/MRP) protein 4